MAVFYGEMNLPDDSEKLPAVVTLDGGRIRIASGRTEIGDWTMQEVSITEHGPLSVQIGVEDESLVLYLTEHQRFLADTEPYRRPEKKRRRREHPAFRRNEQPVETLAEEFKSDVSREVAPITEEAKALLGVIPTGRPLWIGIGIIVVLLVLVPGVVAGLSALAGMITLVIGGIAYSDSHVAVRLPGDLTPVRLVVAGAVLMVAAIVVALLRSLVGWSGVI